MSRFVFRVMAHVLRMKSSAKPKEESAYILLVTFSFVEAEWHTNGSLKISDCYKGWMGHNLKTPASAYFQFVCFVLKRTTEASW